MSARLTETHGDTIRDLVPDDLADIQADAYRDGEDADLWASDIPVCVNCQSANLAAYGGGKQVVRVNGVDLVADQCHDCDQMTVQVLDVHDQDKGDD
jgi:hypothetical protein